MSEVVVTSNSDESFNPAPEEEAIRPMSLAEQAAEKGLSDNYEAATRYVASEKFLTDARWRAHNSGVHPQDIDDIVQDTALHILRYPQCMSPETGKCKWLYEIVEQRRIDLHRKRRGTHNQRPEEILYSPAVWAGDPQNMSESELAASKAMHGIEPDFVDTLTTALAVRGVMASLKPGKRELLFRRVVFEQSVPDTAVIMGMNEGTVKSATYYAIKNLRDAAVQQQVIHE